MVLVLTEEQQMIKDSAKGFLAEKSPVSALRELRDSGNPDGYSKPLWHQMVEMGWPGIVIPEEFGGLGYGYVGAGVVMEEMGRTLTASPMLSTAILAATALAQAGTDEQKQKYLPAIASGDTVAAFAIDEGVQHAPKFTTMTAEKNGDGFKLNGRKNFVLDGHIADTLIVVARTSGTSGDTDGLTAFLVNADAQGLFRRRIVVVDSRAAAKVDFENVTIPAENVLGDVDKAWAVVEHTLNVGRICIAAELLGVAQEAFERTIAYLQERQQFGATIGAFQGLQHRAAHLFSELEVTRSAVLKALQALDEGSDMVPALASLAKARAGDTAQLATNEAVQMHGGIGMTDEFEIGFFMKRAQAARQTFGDSNFHVNRLAEMKGY